MLKYIFKLYSPSEFSINFIAHSAVNALSTSPSKKKKEKENKNRGKKRRYNERTPRTKRATPITSIVPLIPRVSGDRQITVRAWKSTHATSIYLPRHYTRESMGID